MEVFMIAALLTRSAADTNTVNEAETRDEELKQRVLSYLDHQQIGLARRVRVHVVDGIVLLSGSVITYHQKQVAQECWKRVAGIIGVRNELEVRATTWSLRS